MNTIIPVILCGGAGSRLWPASREDYPKQLLTLGGEKSLLQTTLDRVAVNGFDRPIIIAGNEYRFLVAHQVDALDIKADIVLEPVRRDSCAAAIVAAELAVARAADAVVLLLAADHAIADGKAFLEHVYAAIPVAQAGYLVTFGIEPREPASSYGYIQCGATLNEASGFHRIAAFVEKPDHSTAKRLMNDGFLWNSGNFLFSAQTLLDEAARYVPEIAAPVRTAVKAASRDLDFIRVDAESFSAAASVSLDYGIMEKTDRAVVMPSSFDWIDIGTWKTVWQIAEKDEQGNASVGDAVFEGSSGCFVSSPRELTVVLGLNDVVVVNTPDATLIAAKSHSEKVKDLVGRLRCMNRREAINHLRSYRPWGDYEPIDRGGRYQVKRITVRPGAKLSLQSHCHRAEHWVVVSGSALVTVDGRESLLGESQSAYIPLGSVHRLENPGSTPLELIEVQCGDYLGEDDIVRYEDIYNRN